MSRVELHPHQEKAVSEMHNGCVLTGGVGSGKTYTSLAYALLKEPGKKIYVITTAKVRNSGMWESCAAQLGVDFDGIFVDSWNLIGNYADVEDAFFIFDEQRLVGTGAWVKAFYKIAEKNRWVLLSATPGDTWSDYVPVFVANGFYKNVSDFRTQHVIYKRFSKFPQVDRYVNTGILLRRKRLILVEMPLERHTTRHVQFVDCDYDQEKFGVVWKRRWNVYEERPLKDAGELFRVGRKVVATDASRLEVLKSLMLSHQRVIVFYNFDYELEILRTLIPSDQLASDESIRDLKQKLDSRREKNSRAHSERSTTSSGSGLKSSSLGSSLLEDGFVKTSSDTELTETSSTPQTLNSSFAVTEWNGHKHEEIPSTRRWVYLVQYSAGAEGWNCITTNAMVFYSLTYSYKLFEQAMGRIDRINTPFEDLYYYVLTSKSVVDKAVKRSLDAKKDFNTRRFTFAKKD